MDCSSLTELMLCERCASPTARSCLLQRHPGEGLALAASWCPHQPGRYHPYRLSENTSVLSGEDLLPLQSRRYFSISTPSWTLRRRQVRHDQARCSRPYASEEKGAKEFGIHAFLASNTTTNDYYPLAMSCSAGGGAEGGDGLPYQLHQSPRRGRGLPPGPAAQRHCRDREAVRKVYEEILTPRRHGGRGLYTELGRFMLAPYGAW
jgi:hypothetical protein